MGAEVGPVLYGKFGKPFGKFWKPFFKWPWWKSSKSPWGI